jgi:hypothetical protein
MNDIAAGLGSFLCRTALDISLTGAQMAHCYNATAHQRLGYSAAALLLLGAAVAFRRFGRAA